MNIVRLLPLIYPSAKCRLIEEGKCVALTFDDGPIPEVTPWVLDTLDAYGISATFFMVGQNALRNPELVEEVLKRGHSVGNHTHRHLQGLRTPTHQFLLDVAEAAQTIPSRLFRPPHGLLTPKQSRALRSLGYDIVMFDTLTRDYASGLSSEEVVENIRMNVRPGSIIVFHDSLKSWPRLKTALPASIQYLLAEGFTFRKL